MKKQLLELLPALRRFCRSLTSSSDDADDLLQATVERLLSKGAPDGADLGRWTFTVCRNLWIDEYRARRLRPTTEWDPSLHDSLRVDGERTTQLQMQVEEVDRAMRQLPPDQQLILSMVAVQGLSYKEVAEALDLPLGTVMSRLARARGRMVELLNGGGRKTNEDQWHADQ